MTSEQYDNILRCFIIATIVMIDILLFYATYRLVGDLNASHFAAVKECIEINKAANGTVCLV